MEIVLKRYRKTAPGEDGFTYIFYTKAPRSFKKRILICFNQSWIEGKLPEHRKTAIVIPVAPPSLKLWREWLEQDLCANPQENIFGFLKDRSTLNTIVHLVTKITARKARKEPNQWFSLSMVNSLIFLCISDRIITRIEYFLRSWKIKVKEPSSTNMTSPLDVLWDKQPLLLSSTVLSPYSWQSLYSNQYISWLMSTILYWFHKERTQHTYFRMP